MMKKIAIIILILCLTACHNVKSSNTLYGTTYKGISVRISNEGVCTVVSINGNKIQELYTINCDDLPENVYHVEDI